MASMRSKSLYRQFGLSLPINGIRAIIRVDVDNYSIDRERVLTIGIAILGRASYKK